MDTDEYKEFIRDGYRLERKSPLVMLKDQRNSYNYTSFFRTGIRDIEVDPVGFFKATHGLARGSSATCSPKVPPF